MGKIAAENVSGSSEVANPLKDEWGTEEHRGRAEDGGKNYATACRLALVVTETSLSIRAVSNKLVG